MLHSVYAALSCMLVARGDFRLVLGVRSNSAHEFQLCYCCTSGIPFVLGFCRFGDWKQTMPIVYVGAWSPMEPILCAVWLATACVACSRF